MRRNPVTPTVDCGFSLEKQERKKQTRRLKGKLVLFCIVSGSFLFKLQGRSTDNCHSLTKEGRWQDEGKAIHIPAGSKPILRTSSIQI